MNSPDENVQTCKVVFFGERKVGKTSVINRYCHNVYYETTESTCGSDIYFKTVEFDNRQKIKFIIWDTSLSNTYRKLSIQNFLDADAVVLIYQDMKSFAEIKNFWYTAVKEVLKTKIIRLIKSKCDKSVMIDQTEDEMKFVIEKNLTYRRVSAKDDLTINELFKDIGKAFLSQKNWTKI